MSDFLICCLISGMTSCVVAVIAASRWNRQGPPGGDKKRKGG